MTEHKTRWIGDFLLLFGPMESIPRARAGATWTTELEMLECRLLISHPGDGWRGSPLTCWQEESFDYWMIGECWGERSNRNPADWPGHFALLGYEGNTQHWHLWTNRCGTYHIYHSAGSNRVALGTYSPSVASVTNKTLDIAGLAGFFSFGFFPAERTYFEEVKIVRPATHLVLDQSGKILKQERTWEWFHEPDPNFSFDQAVDHFARIFHQVIREQIYGRRVAFPISGGLDSRSTIAALPREGPGNKPWSFSYGYTDDSIETSIGAKIAKTRNLPHTRYTIQPYLFDKLPMVMDSVEGFQDITQCRQAYIVDELSKVADHVMAAHWGDVWLDDMGIHKHPEMDWLDFTTSKFQKHGGWLIENIIKKLSPDFDTKDYLSETLVTEVIHLAQLSDPDFRLKALKTEAWSFRWTTASIRMYQPGAFPLLPFYDPRLVDFFCTIPTEFVAGRRLQIEYLKRYAPDLTRITWQPYDANLYWYKRFNDLLIPKRAINKVIRNLKEKPVVQRNWEVHFLSPEGRRDLEIHLTHGYKKIHDILPVSEISSMLEEFNKNPNANNGYTVSMLLTFSAWMEKLG